MAFEPRRAQHGIAKDNPLQVLLVDPNALFLAALTRILEDDRGAQVETTTNDEHGLALVLQGDVDLVVADLLSRPTGGPRFMMQVRATSPGTRSMLLADPEQAALLLAALACGATGFLTKDASPDEFLRAVDALMAGNIVVGRAVRADLDQLVRPGGADQLSAAEGAILKRLREDKSIRDIAARRRVSEKVVREQLANIYAKLARPTDLEATVAAARRRF